MRVIGRVTLRDVHEALWRGRSPTEGSGPWTGRLLDLADASPGPDWWDVELDAADALAIVLPFHAGEPCHGDRLTLVGPEGLSVAAAARRFADIETEYARANRSCWGRIDAARRAPLSRVVVATAPIDHEEYRGLADASALADATTDTPRLYCLDGRHRLIGWALAGTLAPGAIVAAHVAGTVETPSASGSGLRAPG